MKLILYAMTAGKVLKEVEVPRPSREELTREIGRFNQTFSKRGWQLIAYQ